MHQRPLAFRVGALLLQVLLLSGWGGGLLCLASDGDVTGLHGSFAAGGRGGHVHGDAEQRRHVHHAENAEGAEVSRQVHHAERMHHAEGAEGAEGVHHGEGAEGVQGQSADESPSGPTPLERDSCGLMVVCSAVAVLAVTADAPALALGVAVQGDREPSFDLLSASSSVEPPPPRA